MPHRSPYSPALKPTHISPKLPLHPSTFPSRDVPPRLGVAPTQGATLLPHRTDEHGCMQHGGATADVQIVKSEAKLKVQFIDSQMVARVPPGGCAGPFRGMRKISSNGEKQVK